MKKKLLNSMRVLLVAAGLCVGANAWAQTVTWTAQKNTTYTALQELSTNTDVVSVKLGEGTWSYASIGISTLVNAAPNAETPGTYIKIVPVKDINLSLSTYSSAGNCNLYMDETIGTHIKDFRQKQAKTNDFGTLTAGHTYYIYAGAYKESNSLDHLYFLSFTIKTIESYAIHYVDNSAEPITLKSDKTGTGLYGDEITATEEDMNSISYNDDTYVYSSGNATISLGTTNEITLVFEKSAAAPVNYTVKYMCGETEIANAVTHQGLVGGTATIPVADVITYITYNSVKYKYDSGSDAEITLNEDASQNILTLNYVIAPTYSYNVYAKYDSTTDTENPLFTGNYVDGDDAINVFWPKYKQYNGIWYETNSPYGVSIGNITANYVKEVAYSVSPFIEYVYDGSGMTLSSTYGNVSNNTSYSNGNGWAVSSGANLTTDNKVAAGTYILRVYGIVRRANDDAFTISYSTDKSTWMDLTSVTLTSSKTGLFTASDNIVLPEAAYIKLTESKGQNQCHYIDYIVLSKNTSEFDYTSRIINPSFETFQTFGETSCNHPTGWTIVGESSDANATGGDKYGNIIESGDYWTDSYAYYTGWAGQNIYQTLSGMPAGTYTLTADATSNGASLALIANGGYSTPKSVSGDDKTTLSYTFSKATTGDMTIGIICTNGQNEANYLDLTTYGSWWYRVDNFTLTYTGPEKSEVTVTSAGWATLYTPYALDFSGVTGLEAYTAAVSESTVTLTKVNNVPANTGVVLKGAADTYSIPVIANSETSKGSLEGSATDATAHDAFSGYTLYMLKKVGEKAQFVPMTSGSLAAGKAYLKVEESTGSVDAKALSVVFADETTGISTVNGDETKVNGIFDLQGRKVSQPTKGLYIVNGKKVIIK